MKRAVLALAVLAHAAAMPTFAQSPPPAADSAGTTIVGERDTAVGLYLMPWQEEAPSDIDRPPAHFSDAGIALDAARLHAVTASDEANAAYRRVRTEPR